MSFLWGTLVRERCPGAQGTGLSPSATSVGIFERIEEAEYAALGELAKRQIWRQAAADSADCAVNG